MATGYVGAGCYREAMSGTKPPKHQRMRLREHGPHGLTFAVQPKRTPPTEKLLGTCPCGWLGWFDPEIARELT